MTLTELRAERNARLAACDFYFLSDVYETLNENVRAAYVLYRQALRDLPSAYTEGETIEEVEWPAQPFTSEE